MIKRSYNELNKISSFEERFEYLKLNGIVSEETFGYDRYLNQNLYKSHRWKRLRNEIIIRDNGCDLGVSGFEIFDRIVIHHINPISLDDVLNNDPLIYDFQNLITTSHRTHLAIHFGDESLLPKDVITRYPNDTTLW